VYRADAPIEFDEEVILGQELVQEHAPMGLDGARSLQADLVGDTHDSASDSRVLVECKLEFSLRGIGQLLLYNWLMDADANREGGPRPRVDRRLVLGTAPPSVMPTVCTDVGLSVLMPTNTGWQDITQGIQRDLKWEQAASEEITTALAAEQSATLDSSAEEETLQMVVDTDLPDVDPERLYHEIPVGDRMFSTITSRFQADAIAQVPNSETFYVIEAKAQPDIRGLQKGIGQAVTYASLFRHDWGLRTDQVIPTIIISRAPWLTQIYRNDRYEYTHEMVREAMTEPDGAVILYNQIEVYED
jgi:hypothetical protein